MARTASVSGRWRPCACRTGLVTWTVGVGYADVGLMLKQARWALGLVIGNTSPVGRIFTAGLQCRAPGGLLPRVVRRPARVWAAAPACCRWTAAWASAWCSGDRD